MNSCLIWTVIVFAVDAAAVAGLAAWGVFAIKDGLKFAKNEDTASN